MKDRMAGTPSNNQLHLTFNPSNPAVTPANLNRIRADAEDGNTSDGFCQTLQRLSSFSAAFAFPLMGGMQRSHSYLLAVSSCLAPNILLSPRFPANLQPGRNFSMNN